MFRKKQGKAAQSSVVTLETASFKALITLVGTTYGGIRRRGATLALN